ncbi:hypothetical protein RB195_024732 [Necator americanus]|uniref:Integrase catalytic domain-containing protein n=1 Tax=Necator americanus TaxID=51031 RepID=A0ABR1EPC3_NECAM
MSAEDFLNVLRRFFARRGIPSLIICDNAPTFSLSAEILGSVIKDSSLNDVLSNNTIERKNITPYAPWQGGFYERLIKSIKHALYKCIGRAKLSFDNLTTIITEIEATLNTRPLTYQESDCDVFTSIRPIDFIQKNIEVTCSFENIDSDNVDPEYHPSTELASLETRRQTVKALQSSIKITERFWNIWRDHSLSSLREHHRTRLSQHRTSTIVPRKGAVVLISDPVLPRNDWKMARITDTKSSDGVIREVELITSTRRKIRRPVNLVIPLELGDTDNGTYEEGKNGEVCEENANQDTRYDFRTRKNINYSENSLANTVSATSPGFSFSPKFSLLILTLLMLCFTSLSHPILESLSIECHKNGILVKNTNAADFEICIEDECKLYPKPSLRELVRFSPERTLHEHSVLLKRGNE